MTASLMLAVYAIVNGNEAGWFSTQTIGLLVAASALLSIFIGIEARVRNPLMLLGLFRLRNVATANVVGVLWAAAMFAWFFISALYMQLVLGYSAMQVGLGFLPANLIMAAFSLGLSARLVMRFGIRLPLAFGLLVAAVGLALFARAPVDGNFAFDVLPGMILLGLGAGIAFNPVLLAAMSDVAPSESGLASGVVNTSFMMGGRSASPSLPALPPLERTRCSCPAPAHSPRSAAATSWHSPSAPSSQPPRRCSALSCCAPECRCLRKRRQKQRGRDCNYERSCGTLRFRNNLD